LTDGAKRQTESVLKKKRGPKEGGSKMREKWLIQGIREGKNKGGDKCTEIRILK
jgi:hypothetical protein